MKHFELEPSMVTMGGVFYPTGYMILMLPNEQEARAAGSKLEEGGLSGDKVAMLSPEVIQEKIARTVGSADIPLPSAGTEADTVRKFAELAGQGHYALMIHAPHAEESDRVMELLKGCPISYGQKYRLLVIEDLVD
ncbi:MAG: RNA-binding protein [Ramlibacter sp.]|nr:RNA-binding protein [Ramlibacter sp.]